MSSIASLDQFTLLGNPRPFFRLLEFPHANVLRHTDCIGRLRDGELTGIVVRGVYSSDFMNEVTERLERHEPRFLKTTFPEEFRSWFYGRNLNLMGTDPQTYFAQAAEFHDQLCQLFTGEHSISANVWKLLSQLDECRPYSAAPGPEPGMNYMMTTLRGHAEGGYIPAHCDNEQTVRASYEHLSTLVTNQMYSMVLMIGASDDGGALEVFDHCVQPDNASDQAGALAGKVDLGRLASAQIRLQPGDLVVVDSGRYLHRVTPVIGPRTRWVACSFMAHALERNAVFCWG